MNTSMKSNRPDSVQKAINKAVASLIPPRTSVKGGPQRRSRNAVRTSSATPSLKDGSVANVNSSFMYRNRVPLYTGVKGGIRIRHTEFISDLSASSTAKAFTAERFNINPANSNLFPWLATAEARSYSTFIPHSLRFIMKSVVATNKDGSSMIVATADVSDNVPATKTQFLKTGDAARGHAFADFTYTVPSNILHRLPEYLTYSNPDAHDDNTKAVGTLFVGQSGCDASLDYGELYVEYDFTLLNTQDTVYSSVRLSNIDFAPTRPFVALASVAPSSLGNIYLKAENPAGAFDRTMLRVDEGGSKMFIFHSHLATTSVGDDFGLIGFYDSNNVNIDTQVDLSTVDFIKTAPMTGSGEGFMSILTAKNLPSPFYIRWSLISGSYSSCTVHITPYQPVTPIMFGPSDLLERIKRIEQFVDEDIVHTYVERLPSDSTPRPPCTLR